MKTLVIAEAGVNHNGNLNLALRLVDAAAEAGADIVKFQTFKADLLTLKQAPMATYQQENIGKSGSQLDLLKALELKFSDFEAIKRHCDNTGIEFMSTAFDSESLEFLNKHIDQKKFKIPSGEITSGPLLLEFAKTQKELILSTGMSSIGDIEAALGLLSYGMLADNDDFPNERNLTEAYRAAIDSGILRRNVTLLHCTTEYPAPLKSINLRAMQTIQSTFGLRVGYSDHTAGINVSLAASALGATVVEKHFTLDKNMEGPDHKASLEPYELADLVRGIRQINLATGIHQKIVDEVEFENRDKVRKSLIANTVIKKGEKLSTVNMTIKRPGNGISPMRYWEYLGKPASKDYEPGELI